MIRQTIDQGQNFFNSKVDESCTCDLMNYPYMWPYQFIVSIQDWHLIASSVNIDKCIDLRSVLCSDPHDLDCNVLNRMFEIDFIIFTWFDKCWMSGSYGSFDIFEL